MVDIAKHVLVKLNSPDIKGGKVNWFGNKLNYVEVIEMLASLFSYNGGKMKELNSDSWITTLVSTRPTTMDLGAYDWARDTIRKWM